MTKDRKEESLFFEEVLLSNKYTQSKVSRINNQSIFFTYLDTKNTSGIVCQNKGRGLLVDQIKYSQEK